VKKRYLLDSYAVLAWIQDEKGAQFVEDLLYRARGNEDDVLLNIINLGEIYYRCSRVLDTGSARNMLEKIRLLPIKIISCPNDLVIEAAEIKAQYAIAYADAFALASGIREKACVVTGDPEFKAVEHLAEIHWLS
jgi:predicted nucleic acid-binding protein